MNTNIYMLKCPKIQDFIYDLSVTGCKLTKTFILLEMFPVSITETNMLIPEWEISFVLFWPKQVLAGFWTKLKTQTFYPKVNQIFNQFFGGTCSCKSWQNWFSFSFSFHANNLILLMHLCTFFFFNLVLIMQIY